LAVQLIETMGSLPRASVEPLLGSLTREDRRRLAQAGVRLGVVHVFVAPALRPEATRWRLALWGVFNRIEGMPPPPRAGRVSIRPEPDAPPGYHAVAGFWSVAGIAVRVDMVDRIARAVHAQRLSERAGSGAIAPDPNLAASLGLGNRQFVALMRALGFRTATTAMGQAGFAFTAPRTRGRRRGRSNPQDPPATSPFASLQQLLGD
ncbi:MAG: helicase, partial [Thermaurantiacus sp.]